MSDNSSGRLRIRPARGDDPLEVDRLHDICLWTGNNGEGAEELLSDPRLLGEVYLGAYLQHEPDLAFVLEDHGGDAIGYVLGARDTAAFESLLEQEWWPRLRHEHPKVEQQASDAEARLIALIHAPDRTDPAVTQRFPAHLHVDILPAGQHGGNGRRLLETLFDALRARSVRGVHLTVSRQNTHAIGFYEHLGFTLLHGSTYGKEL